MKKMKKARFGTIRDFMLSSGIITKTYTIELDEAGHEVKDEEGQKVKKFTGYNIAKDRLVVPKGLSKEAIIDLPVLLIESTHNNRFEYGVIQVGNEFYSFSEHETKYKKRRFYRKRRFPVHYLHFKKEKTKKTIEKAKERSIEQRVHDIVVEELEKEGFGECTIRLKLVKNPYKEKQGCPVEISLFYRGGPYNHDEVLSEAFDRRIPTEVIGIERVLYGESRPERTVTRMDEEKVLKIDD